MDFSLFVRVRVHRDSDPRAKEDCEVVLEDVSYQEHEDCDERTHIEVEERTLFHVRPMEPVRQPESVRPKPTEQIFEHLGVSSVSVFVWYLKGHKRREMFPIPQCSRATMFEGYNVPVYELIC